MKKLNKYATVLAAITITSFLFADCGNKEAKTEQEMVTESSEMGIGGGLSWAIPQGWATGAAKSMRLDTYIIAAEGDDIDSAECAVFYFGSTSGGTIEANLTRWAGQFEQPDGSNSMDGAKIGSLTVSGLNITTIDLTGDYLVSGAMMQVTGKKPGYMLLGAIVEGPEGSVFFKLTGPENTVKSAKSGFDGLLQSIKPKLM
jgi:hypothetical protein